MSYEAEPFISVIVPVRNNATGLAACLGALTRQRYPRDRYEVIVADNDSTDGSREVALSFDATCVSERRLSAYAARNKGLAVASGDIIAFTDSDCVPADDWISSAVTHMQRTGCDLAAGHIDIPTSHDPPAAHVFDALCNLRHEDAVNRRGVAFMANLFVKKTVFASVPLNQSARSGADATFVTQAVSRGFTLSYIPETVVSHPPRSLPALIAKAYRIGKGKASLHTVRGGVTSPHVRHLNPVRLKKALKRHGYTDFWMLIRCHAICCSIVLAGIAGAASRFIPRRIHDEQPR